MIQRTDRRPRIAALAAATLAAVLVLTGCGRSSDADSTASSTPIDDEPATGTVTLWAPDGDATVLDEVLASYEEENPDLDLQVTLIPSDEYVTKLQTAMSSGTLPDIAQVYAEAETQFTSSGAFAAVPDGLVDSSTFFPAAWDAGEWEGTVYSVPWYAYTRVLIYRKDLAAAGGATVPTTWDQTLSFYKALQAGGATYGLGGDVGWDTYNGQDLAVSAHQAGSTLLNADGTEWDLDNSEVIAAIEHETEPFLEGVAAVDTPQFLDAQPYFVQGKTGSMISGPWVIASLDQTADQDGWTADHVATAVLPEGPTNGSGQLGGGSWVVNKDSTNASSAWKVVREMAQEETQVAQFKAFGSMPAVEAAWEDSSITDNSLYDAFFEQLKNIDPMPSASTWSELSTAMGTELEAVARGDETAAQAAENLQSQADTIGVGS
ncbi:MAG: extracellular solute-binding protein [Microbacteriaceae bacterium]